jgi:hypothetical protein
MTKPNDKPVVHLCAPTDTPACNQRPGFTEKLKLTHNLQSVTCRRCKDRIAKRLAALPELEGA